MTMTDASFDRDIKHYLKKELQKRLRRNPKYSLRAFAGFLNISHSFLSKILQGQKLVSETTLIKIGRRLNLEESSLEKFKQSLIKKRRIKKAAVRISKTKQN
jgi:transcriptional regulator with XRE-family HTH domain